MGILAFLIILSLLVFVHELGHFFTARKLGIAVEEFGFGLPPRAFGKKFGETIYSINWIPLGGFVRIKGEQGEDPDDPDSFIGRPVWQRALVISAGVIMNAVFAGILLSIGFMVGTPKILDDENLAGATVNDKQVVIASVLDDYPAAEASLEPGDRILAVNEIQIESIPQMQAILDKKIDQEVLVQYERGDSQETTTLRAVAFTDEEGSVDVRGVIGVELLTTGIVSYSFFPAIYHGFITATTLLWDIASAFGTVMYELIAGENVSVDLSGPVGIAVITTEVAKLGFVYLIQFAALLSLNLAIINFIPFPALDGGRFLFLIIEKIKGSAMNQKTEAIIHNVGFGLLMILILLVTVRDLTNLNFWAKLALF